MELTQAQLDPKLRSWMGGSVCNATSAPLETFLRQLVGLVCVICMCRDKIDTRTAIALEPWRPTPSGAHTSSIGPRTTILGGWKPPHSPMTGGRWIFVPILSHFAKRTKFWLLTGSIGPRDV